LAKSKLVAGAMAATLGAGAAGASGPAAPAPTLEYAFTARVEVAVPLELGEAGSGRRRFIPITGGKITGPMLSGEVLSGGGDWQTIMAGGVTQVEARYFLKATDGTAIEVENSGVRVAEPEVIERLARGEDVDPSSYYFRTTPRFTVRAGPHEWLRRSTFVARGIRKPDHVLVDFYVVR
jgi:Protein of unknown function (DUF3237)